MLVLSRLVGERILVGDGIVITVVSVRGDCVRLGIEAPKDLRILREEIAGRATPPVSDSPPPTYSDVLLD